MLGRQNSVMGVKTRLIDEISPFGRNDKVGRNDKSSEAEYRSAVVGLNEKVGR